MAHASAWKALRSPWLFPTTFTVAWVLAIFGVSTAPIGDIWRPLLIGLMLSIAWVLVTSWLSRGHNWFRLGASTAWIALIATWWVAAIIPLLVLSRLALGRSRLVERRRMEPPPAWTARMANALGLSLVVVGLVGIGISGAVSLPDSIGSGHSPDPDPGSEAPNIYLVLLDGYPRTDVLLDRFGVDNGPFVRDLESRGFALSDRSTANYTTTLLTLTSMFHMAYIHEIESLQGEAGSVTGQARRLTTALNRAPSLDLLRSRGYEIVTIPSWYGEATLTAADEVRASPHLTIFEEQVLRLGTLGQLALRIAPDLVGDQQRARISAALEAMATNPSDQRPAFTFVHVFSPHAPFLFDSEGDAVPPSSCYPTSCSFNLTEAAELGMNEQEYAAALGAHLEHLNRLLLQSVDRVIEADPEAVIVLFSDHGARHDPGDVEEHLSILLAARTPGRHGLFAADESPVNLLSLIFNAYLDADLPVREPRAWVADPARPLELREVDVSP